MATIKENTNRLCVEPVINCLLHPCSLQDICMNTMKKLLNVTVVTNASPSRVSWEKHKVIHQKNPSFKCIQANCDNCDPSFKCIQANCDRWFFQNQDLNFHLQTHKKTLLKCPQCDKFTMTNTEKYLKDHIKSVHGAALPYKCEKCNKQFMYRQQRKCHLDSDHRKHKKL